MELKEYFRGYFDLTQEEKESKISDVLSIYITQMSELNRPISEIMQEIDVIIELSEKSDDFEVADGFKTLKMLMNKIINLFQNK